MESKAKFGILIVSDRCFTGETQDESGKEIAKYLEAETTWGIVEQTECVPDDFLRIQSTLKDWCDNKHLDVIFTTGGTGFSPRDVTPEATKGILDREAPGLVIAMITNSLTVTPMAMMARPSCGIRARTIIVTLPGSKKGAIENLAVVIKQLKHGYHLLQNDLKSVSIEHSSMTSQKLLKSSINDKNVAERDRISKYPTIPVTEAQKIIIQECPMPVAKVIKLKNALGHILAEDILAKDPLPPFRASIKDGYAVKVTPNMELLQVLGGTTAGESPDKHIQNDKFCIRISTGAPVPDEADAVIQVEDTQLVERSENQLDEKVIRITRQPKVGQDIREIGCDIKQGDVVLLKNTCLGPAELGILATVGCNSVPVFKRPTIGLLSTGNELQSPEVNLLPGKIRDSNKTTLEAVFQQAGFSTIDLGIARDTSDEVYTKLVEGLNLCDIVVSSGGVSMGEKDFLKRVLQKDLKANIHFGSVAMKPGKPTTFASLDFNGKRKIVFGLPGNPVSATVTCYLFAIPLCRKFAGWTEPFLPSTKVRINHELKLDFQRPEYHRAILTWCGSKSGNKNFLPEARSTGVQSSSRLLSCNTANCLLVLSQATTECSILNNGDIVDALLISNFNY